MFLMSLAPLAMGCPGDDSGTNNTSVNATTNGMNTTGMQTTSGNSSGTNMDTSGGSTDGGSTDTGADSTAGETEGIKCEKPVPVKGPIDQSCIDYAAVYNECLFDGGLPQECIDAYETYCQYMLENETMECATALIEFNACLSLLTCRELAAKDQCLAEEMAFDMACVPKR